MGWLSEVGRRMRMLLHRERFDRDLEDEIRLHLELRQQEHESIGLSEGDARAAARRQFGNATVLREISGDAWGWQRSSTSVGTYATA